MPKTIDIKGARVHNLKNVSVSIPRDKLVVFTGISGSGKSSLAFDTIYAEGQRRYVESLSSYARQFLGVLDKPDVDSVDGLSPTIVIDQRGASNNPRSTVGTMTEVYDYLRLMYARVGHPHCPNCNEEVIKQSPEQITTSILEMTKAGQVMIIVPLIRDAKGEHKRTLAEIRKGQYAQARINGEYYTIEELDGFVLDKTKKQTIEIILPQLIRAGMDKNRVLDLIKQALDLGNGFITVANAGSDDETTFSQYYVCAKCNINLPVIEPRSFSFNSPQGACLACSGLGTRLVVDPALVIPNDKLTISEGAIRPWTRVYANSSSILKKVGTAIEPCGFSLDTPIKNLTEKQRELLLNGGHGFEGIIPDLENKYGETDSDYVKKEIEKYMRVLICPTCKGDRLQPAILAVTVGEKSIADLVQMTITDLKGFFVALKPGKKNSHSFNKTEWSIMEQLVKEVLERLSHLENVGLQYLTMDRPSTTLSGGELQRIRLATQIGTKLTGVVYVLDEPSIGLHARDNEKLIKTITRLRDLGNTVIVVEHDEATMHAADYVIDMGPGAGERGGKIVAQGTAAELMKNSKSLTGRYLSGKEEISRPKNYRKGNGKVLTIHKANAFNLKDVTVDIPLAKLVAITGVSGSGKSTLMTDILAKSLAHHFYRAKELPAAHEKITGIEHIDKVITIDQSPIGRTPRSNPATYTGMFTYIRDLFIEVPESKLKGFKAGQFSFNVKGGRCEACQGEGQVKIEMQMLADVYIMCEECHGRRYNKEALEIYYKGKNIADILDMTVEEARKFFKDTKVIFEKLSTLNDVGLGYLRLGQSATTLSGGEAQRIKLATELSRRSTGKTLYILDEPTTGLHFEDIKRLLQVLNRLVDKGNTVLIIEHNLDVIKNVDWVIDMGPDGGDKGGELVAFGTPVDITKEKRSFTGKYLKEVLK